MERVVNDDSDNYAAATLLNSKSLATTADVAISVAPAAKTAGWTALRPVRPPAKDPRLSPVGSPPKDSRLRPAAIYSQHLASAAQSRALRVRPLDDYDYEPGGCGGCGGGNAGMKFLRAPPEVDDLDDWPPVTQAPNVTFGPRATHGFVPAGARVKPVDAPAPAGTIARGSVLPPEGAWLGWDAAAGGPGLWHGSTPRNYLRSDGRCAGGGSPQLALPASCDHCAEDRGQCRAVRFGELIDGTPLYWGFCGQDDLYETVIAAYCMCRCVTDFYPEWRAGLGGFLSLFAGSALQREVVARFGSLFGIRSRNCNGIPAALTTYNAILRSMGPDTASTFLRGSVSAIITQPGEATSSRIARWRCDPFAPTISRHVQETCMNKFRCEVDPAFRCPP